MRADGNMRYYKEQEAFSVQNLWQPRSIICRPERYSISIAIRTRKKEENICRRPAVRQCGDLP